MTTHVWRVPGKVLEIIDGDTIKANLDLGWHISLINQSIRLIRIDCPELDTSAGKAARTYTSSLIPVGSTIMVASASLDKYGRILGDVLLLDGSSLSTHILEAGHAVPYRGLLKDKE